MANAPRTSKAHRALQTAGLDALTSDVRVSNCRATLRAVSAQERTSRAGLARAIGRTRETMSGVVADLIECGLRGASSCPGRGTGIGTWERTIIGAGGKHVTLLQLRVLLAVVDQAGFTMAAGQIGMSQPAVSRAIATLESELVAVLPADHRLARQSAVGFGDLANEPFILPTGGWDH